MEPELSNSLQKNNRLVHVYYLDFLQNQLLIILSGVVKGLPKNSRDEKKYGAFVKE